MGTRVNYEIVGRSGEVALTLYCNNSHESVDPDRLFMDIIDTGLTHGSPMGEIMRSLLDRTYPSANGNHREGDPIFTVDLAPHDHEYVLRAVLVPQGDWSAMLRFDCVVDGRVVDVFPATVGVSRLGKKDPETRTLFQVIDEDGNAAVSLAAELTKVQLAQERPDQRFIDVMKRTDLTLTQKVAELLSIPGPNDGALFDLDVLQRWRDYALRASFDSVIEGRSNPFFEVKDN